MCQFCSEVKLVIERKSMVDVLAWWLRGKKLCLQCRHPIWKLVQVLSTPLANQLPADALRKVAKDGPCALDLCHPYEGPRRSSWLPILCGPASAVANHLESKPADGTSFCLFSLSETLTSKWINNTSFKKKFLEGRFQRQCSLLFEYEKSGSETDSCKLSRDEIWEEGRAFVLEGTKDRFTGLWEMSGPLRRGSRAMEGLSPRLSWRSRGPCHPFPCQHALCPSFVPTNLAVL